MSSIHSVKLVGKKVFQVGDDLSVVTRLKRVDRNEGNISYLVSHAIYPSVVVDVFTVQIYFLEGFTWSELPLHQLRNAPLS
jgi:hypothetical protein